MFDFLLADNTFTEYPIQTLIHHGQGVVGGILLVRAHFRGGVGARTYAMVLIALFVAYEALEQARIADRGDVDVLNMAVALHVAALLTYGYYSFRLLYSKRKHGRKDNER